MNREQYLTTAADIIRSTIIEPAIEQTNTTIERDVKIAVSIGHPKSKRALGECWSTSASDDKETNAIFITPHENDSLRILDVLTHELIHAYDDNESGHRGRFALLARAVGLTGKLTATTAGPELKQKLEDIIDALGEIPHHKLDQSTRPKQSTRMLKIECEQCDFVFRASRTQISRLNPIDATCPCCQQPETITRSIINALAN